MNFMSAGFSNGSQSNDDAYGFFLNYATGDLAKELEAKSGRIVVKYLHYDWSLNGM
jgi:hypothetical protein